jgi:hypothetical protein
VRSNVPISEELISRLRFDYASRILGEEYTKKASPKSLLESQCQPFQNNVIHEDSYCMLCKARFIAFAFLTRPISYESVGALLECMFHNAMYFEEPIREQNIDILFADFFAQTVLLEGASVPYELVLMIRNAAYVIVRSRYFKEATTRKHLDLSSPRMNALKRWFTPWFGIDLLDGVTRFDKEYPKLMKRKEFLEKFKLEVSTIRKFLDLDNRLVAIPDKSISQFTSMIAQLFLKTELDLDMIDLIAGSVDGKTNLVDNSIQEILLYCIQSDLNNFYCIDLPEVPK